MKYISFAIPCYNSAEYMEHAIQSILPAGEDVEIIVVNDGSKDETAEIAARYEKEYPTIVKAVNKENGGHGDAVNVGLDHATGLYYKVVDSDCLLYTSRRRKNMKQYDYLIVGAGLYGAVAAHELTKKGKSCLVIDRRDHIAGNVYTEEIEGINVHKYGAHIFHTSNKEIWDYINQFAEFNNYINSPVAIYKDELYNLPFNMNTFSKMWNIKTPQEAKDMIAKQVAETGITAVSYTHLDVYKRQVQTGSFGTSEGGASRNGQ